LSGQDMLWVGKTITFIVDLLIPSG
jgi:hypothetical protein